jgi:mannose-6-phosphate isomerase
MWYVLAAKPGAFLYEGFSHDIDETEFRQRIADGTITDVLQKHEVKAGDVFYIPSGTVHAICSGLLVAEIQQSSDLTYRIFDYNRPGLDGKPRQLHVDLAAEALNFKAGTNYQSQYQYHEGQANTVVSSPYFNVRVLDIDHSMHCDIRQRDSFVILMCLEGDCHIHVHSTGEDVTLRHGYSAMIPAAIADYDIVADSSNGKSKVIDAFL